MSTWASPRDEFPESVHALMSLWGGFAPPTQRSTDGALEKRLELDFASPIDLFAPGTTPTLSVAEVEKLVSSLGQYLEDFTFQEAEAIAAITFTDTLVVLTTDRIIITCGAAVMLHEIIRPLLSLLTAKSVTVAWAAFFRKNIHSPWATDEESDKNTSDVMATEYAELKAAFPLGQSFLTGPIDGDHYFHFVYDNITRGGAACEEDDVQVNVFFYDCEQNVEMDAGRKNSQVLVPLPLSRTGGCESEYEMLRTFASFPHVSFETNARAAMQSADRVAQLVRKFAPSRFIIVALEDTHGGSDTNVFSAFDGYVRQHRSINHFGEGYAFHQLVYVRAE